MKANEPTANGATWDPSSKVCYAEYGMTTIGRIVVRGVRTSLKTCKFRVTAQNECWCAEASANEGRRCHCVDGGQLHPAAPIERASHALPPSHGGLPVLEQHNCVP